MPVRFTDSPNAEARLQGIFKHARGILRGWEQAPEEEQRITDLEARPEVVLKKRPVKLFVEVPQANAKLPTTHGKKIYVLRVCMKVWHLDKDNKVPIQRYGFPLIPDFGGTAHAYCGDTLKACVGDLMKWTTTPTMDQALRAYIIKSRVRDGSNLLLAQPYSPMLLRQGVQPGPHLLLETLRRKLTPKEAKAQWAVFEKQQHEKDKHIFLGWRTSCYHAVNAQTPKAKMFSSL